MPASLKRTRENMKVARSPRDAASVLTITVKAYDKGMIEVDGVPMATHETGWLDAVQAIAIILGEFQRQAKKQAKPQ